MEPVNIEGLMRESGMDRIPNTRVLGTDEQLQKQMKNVREATKALRDRLKEEGKKFDGGDVFSMILIIIVSEEIVEQFKVAETASADLRSPDVVSIMFNNLQGRARDWIRTQQKTSPRIMKDPQIFKDILLAKYFGMETPFEGLTPLYQVKQKENQPVKEFATALQMLSIYLGRRHASVIPWKKRYLTR